MTTQLREESRPTLRWPERRSASDDRDLRYYVDFVRTNWGTIVTAVVIAMVLGTALFLNTTPKYRARTDVVVVAISDLTSEGKKASDVSIDSAVQVLLSDQVLGETARALNYPNRSSGLIEDMDISPLINSRILRIYVSSPTPELAHDAVTLLTENFLAARLSALQNNEGARAATLKAQLSQLQVSLDAARALPDTVGTTANDTISLLTEQQASLQTELIALSVSAAEPGYVSHAAELPVLSARPRGMVFAGSALAVGLLAGCTTATVLTRRHPRHRIIS